MLGIFLIICLAVFLFIKLKAYSLLQDSHIESVELDSVGRTYNVCYRAVVLYAISMAVALIGCMGCLWPYLFTEGIDRSSYFFGIVIFGLVPVLSIAYVCYLDIRNPQAHIRISIDEIEYKRHKSFSVKVSDIKAITYLGMCLYQIHLSEKGKPSLRVNLNEFNKRREICSLMNQLREYSAKVSGQDRSLANKLGLWRLNTILGKIFPAFVTILIVLSLLYTSYCCIDYDFFKKDYTASFNALGAEPNQSENAWPHYVQAAVNYTELKWDFREIIEDSLKSNQFNLTDDQNDNLRKWFNENASSWASLKKAVSINYCNATYEHVSLFDNTKPYDFSNSFDTCYGPIRHLYRNVNACRLAGVLDLDWFDLFQMQLASSKHFVNGKLFIDQLVGYGMLTRSIKLLAKQANYQPHDLQEARRILKEHFPEGLPLLSTEGEILMCCGTFDDMINIKKIPVQTPFNPMFLCYGSLTGTERYARKRFTAILEQARKGIKVESKGFSITAFPILRNMLLSILDESVAHVYKVSQRVNTNLLAAYFLLDLEEYKLIKGCYPSDVSQLRQAGLTSQLPDDPDADGNIIYSIDGERAVLYAVGKNTKDDGGYRDDRESDQKRDDIIYWERNLKEEKGCP
jgi:hypothetical protein